MYKEFYDMPLDEQKRFLPMEHLEREREFELRPEVSHLWQNYNVNVPPPVKFDFSHIRKFTWNEWRKYFDETVELYKNKNQ